MNDCNKYATYKYIIDKYPIYCYDHKENNMISFKNDMCIEYGCNIHANYGYKDENNLLYCSIHKKDNMIENKHKKCIFEGCNLRRKYNLDGLSPLYCSKHKTSEMINRDSKLCKTTLCYTRISDKFDGYCLYCYINTYPNNKISKNYKTKERCVVDFIKNNFNNFIWKTDQKVENGCSKRRPDLLLDLGHLVIIVEIDENQHIDYDCSCETKRVLEIYEDIGQRPTIFIRFNPDNYYDKEDFITSCWTNNNKGLAVVKKSKIKEWNNRLNILKNIIDECINKSYDYTKSLDFIYLFFDNI
jgi:hypothetical protein